MNELSQAPKDTSQSCIFDFPDRPDRPDSPVDGNGPYDPLDDWPQVPVDPPVPGVDPIPGSDPHPYPASPFPPTSPTVTFNDAISYEPDLGSLFYTDPPFGYLGSSPNYYKNVNITPDVGVVIGKVMFANKNAARVAAGAALLTEQGLAVAESGIYLTYCNVGAVWYVYLCYYARNGTHYAVAPVSLSGVDDPPNSVIGVANLTVSSWFLGGTITPKSFSTGALYLVDGTIPLNFVIG